jgi:hypothetical protein
LETLCVGMYARRRVVCGGRDEARMVSGKR